MAEVVMPRLSDSMEEGTVLQWLKQVGDEVAVGDELVEIETDKANMAYESDVAGTLSEILVQEGETVPIGTPIARVGEGSEAPGRDGEGSSASAAGPVAAGDPPPPAVAEASSAAGPPTAPPAEEAINAPTGSNGGGRPHASPVARRIAKEKGVDLSELQGSGPGGRIVKADVERAGASAGADGDGGSEPGGAAGIEPGPLPPQPGRQDLNLRPVGPRNPHQQLPHLALKRPREPSPTKTSQSSSRRSRGAWRSRRRPLPISTSRRRSI